MNFVNYYRLFKVSSRIQIFLYLFLVTLSCIYVVGCGDQIHLPSEEQLVEFENASPVRPTVDLNLLETAQVRGGPYLVMPGEVLELSMPAILQVVTAEAPKTSEEFVPYVCRVSESGIITLPVVGEIEVAGKSITEIESAVIDAYYPKYAVVRPSVFARVREYRTAMVTINGAVRKPGIYSLRSDQMSIVSLIMEAGGIVDEGASSIRIIRSKKTTADNKPVDEQRIEQLAESIGSDSQEENLMDNRIKRLLKTISSDHTINNTGVVNTTGKTEKGKPLVIPVTDLDFPFANVSLEDGDIVKVERLEKPVFTVIGLVNQPGNYPYPSDVQYNLIQAVGFAGGFNQAAEPRYATVYRMKADGTITSVTFNVVDASDSSKLTNASNVLIKPGDIVAVEHTPRT
ncbi:MAG: SLBB domain-containing protein, partial [Dehalococcoidia bacterium]